ncbi:Methylcrotonoyl-CoA carboxylase 1 [Carabus blaptoides fortunei]
MALYARYFFKCSGPLNAQLFRWKSTLTNIDKVLIANRGEIACRVMKTARRLGVKTVAVYSDIDENAMHVAMADEAYNIGPASAQSSYLRGDNILRVAKQAGCQAIHPGYGFLSESVEFADLCQKTGIIFIGPPASAIRDMGIKSTSKAIMSAAGVPIVEGYHGEDQSDAKLKQEADKIGYPIMIKAVRGGGGKGMRIALSAAEFAEALDSARRESQKSFGDSDVLLERFVGEPRHVEVQVFADTHGNAVHLFERDCSVQRRHQKIIEEAPAPGLSEELRKELGAAAVRAAKAVGYVGAGTVEFILDRHTHSFHFMEMNTRLQVEHPITEMITGTDLVEWQLKIAAGEKLPVQQDDIKKSGHAFEARIYAEDPKNDFMPGAGPLLHLSTPESSNDVRVETGVRETDEVSVHYDPMIAKLVVWGKDRHEALMKLQAKLVDYNIAGLETNINFLLDLCKHPEFAAGNVHTNFIKDHNHELFIESKPSETVLAQAAVTSALVDELNEISQAINNEDQWNPFVIESGFRVNYNLERIFKFTYNKEEYVVKVKYIKPEHFQVSVNNGKWQNVQGNLTRDSNKIILNCKIDGVMQRCKIYSNNEYLCIFNENGKIQFGLEQPKYLTAEEETSGSSSSRAIAPMPGVLDKILVKKGDSVEKGDPLFVIIAMKMEHVVKANRGGKISEILFNVGSNVPKDSTIVKFEDIENK